MDAPVDLSKILPAVAVDSSTGIATVQRPMRLRGVARGTIRAYRPGLAGDEVLLFCPSAASADAALRPEDWSARSPYALVCAVGGPPTALLEPGCSRTP